MNAAIQFHDVWRSFGRQEVLRGLTFDVPRGSISALLGRNGVGKSTALRCLVGLLRPDSGHILVRGVRVFERSEQERARLSFLSDAQTYDSRMSIGSLIEFTGMFYDTWDDALVDELLDRFELHPSQHPGQLSQGMRRKLGLLLSLSSRPDVLVLDEPMANLDAVVRREFAEVLLEEFARSGMTILLSTHQLADVERLADHIVFMRDGKAEIAEPLDDLKDRVKCLRIRYESDDSPRMTPSIPGLLSHKRWGREDLLTVTHCDADLIRDVKSQTGRDVEVVSLSLEDIFLAIARETVQY